MDTYDEIPYESLPFSDAHPVNLAALSAGCLDWRRPIPNTAGCWRWAAPPAAISSPLPGTIRGAILSESTVYILVHGVYSWVPEPVRDRIMQLCAKHLSPTGIAYISYNTLPGWRMRSMLRDVFLFHTRNASRPQEKVVRLQTLLPQLDVALEKMDTDCGRYLKREIAYLRAAHPSYLYHEYLEDINTPFLFSHFMEGAQRHKLQYLCDVDLKTMFPSTLGEGAENLVEAFDDLIEHLQSYADPILLA